MSACLCARAILAQVRAGKVFTRLHGSGAQMEQQFAIMLQEMQSIRQFMAQQHQRHAEEIQRHAQEIQWL